MTEVVLTFWNSEAGGAELGVHCDTGRDFTQSSRCRVLSLLPEPQFTARHGLCFKQTPHHGCQQAMDLGKGHVDSRGDGAGCHSLPVWAWARPLLGVLSASFRNLETVSPLLGVECQ